MKNVLFIILALFLFTSCEKDESAARESRIFRIEATGTNFSFQLSKRDTGTDKEGLLESLTGYTGPYHYEFTPEIGKTYKVTLGGAGIQSFSVSYKGEVLIHGNSPGSGLNKDFVITD